MPPSKWTCPRERTPATANTSYAVPQRRSRRRLAGSPKPPMESRQAHSIHGVALSRASSRPRCATRGIPAPRCRARPAHNAAQSHQTKAPRPGHPAHGTSMRPIRVPKKQKYAQNCNFFAIANCREASKRGLTPGKAANRTHSGPFPPRGGRKGVRNRKKVAQKSEFLFLRNGSSQRSNSCERHVCLQCQSGRAAARNHSASTIQALMPSPLAKIPR